MSISLRRQVCLCVCVCVFVCVYVCVCPLDEYLHANSRMFRSQTALLSTPDRSPLLFEYPPPFPPSLSCILSRTLCASPASSCSRSLSVTLPLAPVLTLSQSLSPGERFLRENATIVEANVTCMSHVTCTNESCHMYK